MKAIVNRLRQLENAAVPAERGRAAAEAILEARRQRLGADYVEPIPYPPDWFAGCRTHAAEIIRVRKFVMKHQGLRKRAGDEDD